MTTLTDPARRLGGRVVMICVLMLAGAGTVKDATAYGETRTLSFHHTHSGEDLTVTFKRQGRYDEDALKKLNHFLRDWRSQEQTTMNRQLFDIIWEVYRDVGGKEPVQIISSYRSPNTNAMLRRRSSGVARFSQHMQGNAMDFFIPGVSLEQIRFAGLRLQRGGVGFYPTSGSPFVHLDTGRVRHWPRMTRDQLVRVFPNGRTVHVPTDGNPLPGYALAMADISRRANDSGTTAGAGRPTSFASLLGLRQGEDEEESPSASTTPPVATPTASKPAGVAAKPAIAPVQLAEAESAPVPMPRSRPAMMRLASADTRPAPDAMVPHPIARPPQPAAIAPAASAMDVIRDRGLWGDDAQPVQDSAETARPAERETPALAFASPSIVEKTRVMAASAPMPSLRPTLFRSIEDDAAFVRKANRRPAFSRVAAVTAAEPLGPWMRALIVTPSVRDTLAVSSLAEPNVAAFGSLLAKPRVAVAMAFSPTPDVTPACDHFSGSSEDTLPLVSFVVRTAALR